MEVIRDNIHINWGKSTVGDGAADSTSERESGVERDRAELLLSWWEDNLDVGHICVVERIWIDGVEMVVWNWSFSWSEEEERGESS